MPVDGDIVLKAGLDTTGITDKIDGLQKSITRGLKNIIRVGFGVRSVFALIRRLRSALMEGFGELSQVHEPFNEAMSSIVSALRTLRNTFASAFAPIIETVAPILVTFINLISGAVSAIGQFVAALTGKEYVHAGAVQIDYAESLNKSTNSSKKSTEQTKKQTEAQKKLNREITHFDDLVILHDKDDDDKEDTTAPVTTTPAFSTMPVGDAVSQFALDFKSAWEKADFTDIGRIVGEKLKSSLEKIPWDKVKSTLAQVAKSVATFLNGFLETPGLFNVVGKTIGEGINSAVTFAKTFVENFHWDSLGKAVSTTIISALNTINWNDIYATVSGFGKGLATYLNNLITPETFKSIGNALANVINSAVLYGASLISTLNWPQIGLSIYTGLMAMLQGIDWTTIYKTMANLGTGIGTMLANALNNPQIWTEMLRFIVNGIGAVLIGINSFVTSINWSFFGKNIGTGLNNAINDFDWNSLSTTLINIVNGAFSLLYNFVTTFDFRKFGTHVGTAISDTIKNINWGEGGLAVGTTITKLYETINGFVTSVDWGAVGKAIIDAIAGFFNGLNWSEIGAFCSNKIKAFFTLLTGAFEEINWEELPSQITTAIKDFLTGFDWEGVAKSTGNLIGAAFKGIGKVAGNLWNAMLSFGKSIIDGGLQGIVDALKGIVDWINTHIVQPFINGFKEAFGIASPAKKMEPWGAQVMMGILQGILNVMLGIPKWIKENIVDPFITNVKEFFGLDDDTKGKGSSLYVIGQNIVASIKAGIANIMQAISKWIQKNITDPIINGIKSFFGLDGGTPILFSVGADLIEGLKNGILSVIDGIGGWIEDNVTKPICGFFEGLFGIGSPSKVFHEYGDWLMEGLKDGINEGTSEPKEALNTAQITLQNAFAAADQLLKWIGLGNKIMRDGLKAGIAGTTQSVVDELLVSEGKMRTSLATQSILTSWISTGTTLMSYLGTGVSNSTASLQSAIYNVLVSMHNYAGNVSFYDVGVNVAQGMYNGLYNNSGTLATLAWNVATNMYNNACAALGVESPSKKFEYIGQMVTQGWANGINENAELVTGAVDAIAENLNYKIQMWTPSEDYIGDGLIEDAEEAGTTMGETMGTSFADSISSALENLSTTWESLETFTSLNTPLQVPAVAQGMVAPSSVYVAAETEQDLKLSEMSDAINNMASNQLTSDDMHDIMLEMFEEHMDLDFYIDDEQIARHANSGNLKLDRRYAT